MENNNDMDILTNLSLFSGVGGLDLAAKWTGRVRSVCYVEKDRYAQGVLRSRIRDGGLDDAPIWGDITNFDGNPWRGRVDIISGGFPCQDLSRAGNQKGIQEGTRSGLWSEYKRLICEVRPRFVLVENVAGIFDRELGRVLGDLAQVGMDAKWGMWGACEVGSYHTRERMFLISYPEQSHVQELEVQAIPVHRKSKKTSSRPMYVGDFKTRTSPPSEFLRLGDGVAFGVERIKRAGNGVVPQQALPAWEEIIRLNDMEKT